MMGTTGYDMKIGPYCGIDGLWPRAEQPRTITEGTNKPGTAAGITDTVQLSPDALSATGRANAAPDNRPQGQDAERTRNEAIERAKRNRDSGRYQEPDVKRELARRIAERLLKESGSGGGNCGGLDNSDKTTDRD